MIEAKEVSVQEIVIADSGKGGINLPGFLEKLHWQLSIGQRLHQIHLSIPDGTLTPDDLGQLVNPAFGSFSPDTTGIYHNDQEPITEDFSFAREFNLILIPRFAYLAQATDGAIEAWISPVLLTEEHPLAKKAAGSTVALFTQPTSTAFLSISRQTLRSFEDLVLGRYLRLTVADELLVVANITGILGDKGINIWSFRQPKPPLGSPLAQLALVLNPCSGKILNSAVEKILAFRNCESLDVNLPVLAPNLPGFLREQPT